MEQQSVTAVGNSSVPIHVFSKFEKFADKHGLVYLAESKTYFVRKGSAIAKKIIEHIGGEQDPLVSFVDVHKCQQEEFLEYDIRQEFIDSLTSE